jgi:hypothetical protein
MIKYIDIPHEKIRELINHRRTQLLLRKHKLPSPTNWSVFGEARPVGRKDLFPSEVVA